MDFYDYFYNVNQSFFSAFGDTSRTNGKKASTNHFDGFITPFDQIMARHLPFSDGFNPRTGERITIMSHLVDKMRAESDMLKRKIMSARQNMEGTNNEFDTKLRCLDIAFRISGGERVSAEDLSFLKENDPELYYSAMFR